MQWLEFESKIKEISTFLIQNERYVHFMNKSVKINSLIALLSVTRGLNVNDIYIPVIDAIPKFIIFFSDSRHWWGVSR